MVLQEFRDIVVQNHGYPLLSFLAALFALIAGAVYISQDSYNETAGGIALGGAIGLLLLSLIFFWQGRGEGNTDRPKLQLFLALLNFAGWLFYVGYTTFVSPFTGPSNGYFSAWLGFAASFGMISHKLGNLDGAMADKAKNIGPAFVALLVGSVLVIIVGALTCCGEFYSILAIAAGAITVVFTFVHLFFVEAEGNRHLYFAYFHTFLWLTSTLILVAFGPLSNAGNGFFGCWACLIASITLLGDDKVERNKPAPKKKKETVTV